MERRAINPWAWQKQYAFSQGIEVAEGKRVLYCAGQTAIDEHGQPAHEGDMRAQLQMAFDNLEAVLKASDFDLGDVVRINYYTTDVPSLFAAHDIAVSRLAGAESEPASTLLGIQSLAFPELMIEIEATAVK